MTSWFVDRTLPFFDGVVFLLSSLFSGPSFMPKSLPLQELRQFLLIRNLSRSPVIENTTSEFCPIFGYSSELRIPNLARMFLMKVIYAAKCQIYTPYCFWVIKRKPAGGENLPSNIHNRTHTHKHARTHTYLD